MGWMFNIIKADKNDFEGIFLLLMQLWVDKKFDKEKLKKAFLSGLEDDAQEYLVIKYEKQIVGFASLTVRNSLWIEGRIGHIDELIIDQKLRSKGIGTRLMQELIKLAKTKGCNRIEADTGFQRKRTHKFYELLGFEKRAYLYSKKLI